MHRPQLVSWRTGSLTLIAIALLHGLAAPATAQTPVVRTIESGNDDEGSSITVLNGQLAVSFVDNNTGDMKLWYDNGAGGGTAGDAIVNGSEIRVIDSTTTVGLGATRGTDITVSNGHLAVAYYDGIAGYLLLWLDDTIDGSGGVGYEPSITDMSGQLAISYVDYGNAQLKLWYDDGASGGTPGDGIANGGEIRVTDPTMGVGSSSSITSAGGYLATSYWDATNVDLRLWWDDGHGGGTAGDGLANGGEIRVIDSATQTGTDGALTVVGGMLAASYYDFDCDCVMLWYDDGRGGGTAGDGIANGSEIRTVVSSIAGGGRHTTIASSYGRLAVGFFGGDAALHLWYDDGRGGGTAGDGIANGSEDQVLDASPYAGLYGGIVTYGTTIAYSYSEFNNYSVKLALLTNAVPGAPSSLGPTDLVNGSTTGDTTPTLQFTQADGNSGDTLAFQIQIDDTSNFSSPVVDYTSAALAQGAASFTVGQSAGSGSYTVGSASQTLARGSFYWRVRSTDYAETGSWSTANSGSIAFKIAVAPTVTTASISSIATTTASGGGNVTDDGNATISGRGVCWSTSQNPTTANSHSSDGSGAGSFTSAITGLAAGTQYFARAYATNAITTVYGDEITFTTASPEPDLPSSSGSGSDQTMTPEPPDDGATAVEGTTTDDPSGGNSEPESDGNAPTTGGGFCGLGSLFGFFGWMMALPLRTRRPRPESRRRPARQRRL